MIDEVLPGVGRRIVDERGNLLRRGWQSDEIKVEPTYKNFSRREGGKRQTLLFQALQEKTIDR